MSVYQGEFDMGNKNFNKDIEPQCILCEHGSVFPDNSTILCRKAGGVTDAYNKCKKFKYDPLKREPKIISVSKDFTQEDFKLD